MCIYCGTKKYREIYTHHNGPIPLDEDGRTYEVHHLDGNRNNNVSSNLVAVSIKEHYQIHYDQGDWAACLRIKTRMSHTTSEISDLSKKTQKKRLDDGTHPFISKENIENTRNRMKQLYEDNEHPFQQEEIISKIKQTTRDTQRKRFKNGDHQFLKPEIKKLASERSLKATRKSIENGTHAFVDLEKRKEYTEKQLKEGRHVTQNSEMQRQKALTRVKNGSHPWCKDNYHTKLNEQLLADGNHPSQKKILCIHCNKKVDSPNFSRWHGNNCKLKSQ